MAKKKSKKVKAKPKVRKIKKAKPKIKRIKAKKACKICKPAKKAAKIARPAPKPAVKPAPVQAVKFPNKKLVGEISHFFDNISVGVIEVKDTLKVGDRISIEGPQTNFQQTVNSMQIEHQQIQEAKKGNSIGMKTAQPVRKKDLVYKL